MGTVALLLLQLAAGCQETLITHRTPPLAPMSPARQRPAPADAVANALVLSVHPGLIDTNGNGYPDEFLATAYLIDRRYPPPLREDGAFVFELFTVGDAGRPGLEPIHRWRIEGEALKLCYARAGAGVCYQFRPSLLDGGTDELSMSYADLRCRFEPADGRPPVYAGEVATLQVGRRVLVPQERWQEIADPAPAAPN